LPSRREKFIEKKHGSKPDPLSWLTLIIIVTSHTENAPKDKTTTECMTDLMREHPYTIEYGK